MKRMRSCWTTAFLCWMVSTAGCGHDGVEPVCTPEEKKCSGSDVVKCNSAGTEWVFYKECDKYCSGGECTADVPLDVRIDSPTDAGPDIVSDLVPDVALDDTGADVPEVAPDTAMEVEADETGVDTCQPSCEDNQCGEDGCGGSCGSCPGTQGVCIEGTCVCQPECGGKECGGDGCGGECGVCEEHFICDAGTCVYNPWCGDGACDPEESCWNCPSDCDACCGNSVCEPDYQETCLTCVMDCACGCGEECQEGSCIFTTCDDLECGDDGCGGECGDCEEHYSCSDGECVYVPWCGDNECTGDESCESCPTDCGICCGDGVCSDGYGEDCSTCPADCACTGCGETCAAGNCVFTACDGVECGDDGCGGSCGTCSVCGETCVNGSCEFTACVGKDCGDDGCGGSCGTCEEHYLCEQGTCVYQPWCGDNACDPDEFCWNCPSDCGSCCGNGLCEPEYQETCQTCVFDCACGCGEECQQGTCIYTACDALECGDDGCGGNCGTCEEHYSCADGKCVYVPWCGDEDCNGNETCNTCPLDCGICCGDGECTPEYNEDCSSCQIDCGCACGEECQDGTCVFTACDGLECGDDGCGGSCGVCEGDAACTQGVCVPLLQHDWSKTFVGQVSSGATHLLTMDASEGWVYIAGSMHGPNLLDLGSGPLGGRFYLAKLQPGGDLVWAKSFGTSAGDAVTALGVDSDGNLYFCGHFSSSSLELGGAPLLNSSSQQDLFVAKFSSTGSHVWSKRYGGDSTERCNSLTIDKYGNVLVSGNFYDSGLDLGEGILASTGNSDVFVAKLDKNGSHIWSMNFGGNDYDVPSSVVSDDNGNTYIAGVLKSWSVWISAGIQLENDLGGGIWNGFVMKLDSAGEPVWANLIGRCSWYSPPKLALCGDSFLCVAGTGTNNDFGDDPLPGFGGTDDVYVAKFTMNGEHVWSKVFGGKTGDYCSSLSIGSKGDVYLAGFAGSDGIDFGGGPLDKDQFTDIFLVRLDSTGNHVWSAGFAGSHSDEGYGLAVTDSGQVYLVGAFYSPQIDFGGGSLVNEQPHAWRLFMAKFKQ